MAKAMRYYALDAEAIDLAAQDRLTAERLVVVWVTDCGVIYGIAYIL